MPILPEERDPRLITIRRGGTLSEHELGAAAYAIRAAVAAAVEQGGADAAEPARLAERDWQRAQLPPEIRELVLEDQLRRSPICWHVFDD